MAKKAKIDIVTSGDTKGAKDVEKSLKGIEKQSIKTEKTTKKLNTSQGRLSATMKKQFPTFIKGGKAIKGMAGSLGSMLPMLNPVTIAMTALAAAAAFVVSEFNKWRAAQQRVLDNAAKGFPEVATKMDVVIEKTDELTTASGKLLAAQNASTKAAAEASAARNKEISDLEAVSAAKIKAAKAEIDLAVAKGELTELQASEKKSLLDSSEAQTEYQNKVNLAKEELERKNKAAKEALELQRELQKLTTAAAAAEDELLGGDKEAVKKIGRSDLNADFVEQVERGKAAAAKLAEGKEDRAIANSPSRDNKGISEDVRGNAFNPFQSRGLIDKKIEDAEAEIEAAEAGRVKAQEARRAAVQAESDRRRGVKTSLEGRTAGAAQNVLSANAAVATAKGSLNRTQTTGKAILNANEKTRITEQKTRGVEAAASAAPAVKNSGQGPAAAVLAVVKQAAAAAEANKKQDEEFNRLLAQAISELNSNLILRESTKKQIAAQVREAMKASNKR